MDKQQLLEEVLVAVNAAEYAYVELRCYGARFYDLLAVGPEAAQSIEAFFKKRRPFKWPFELCIKDVANKKTTKSLYWAGSAT
jgi:hypothetical protein